MRAAPYKIAASLVASCSNRFNTGMTDHLISTRIQQIPGRRLSGTVSVARFRRLNALVRLLQVQIFKFLQHFLVMSRGPVDTAATGTPKEMFLS
jgi:hypothetical protein